MSHADLTRRFFLGTGACAALSARRAWAGGSAPVFHSRHIPEPWLNLETAKGREIRASGLCETPEPDMLRRLRGLCVELIETRLVWWELEATRGRFDWSRVERDIARIEKGGLKVGLMCWLQHPPAWYDQEHSAHTRYRCLEHGQDSTILSLWDPATFEVYDRLLDAVSQKLRGRLSFVYAMVSGDYGEVCYPSGVKHYRFSPEHGHVGYWSADRRARASFRAALEKRYGTPAKLNAAWGTRFRDFGEDLMPRMPFADNPLAQRRDYMEWYTGSLLEFTGRVCGLYRRHFPGVTASVPIGFTREDLRVGQIKSRAIRIGAQYGMSARWTGCAVLGSFGASNVPARRVASAAHFYKVGFGEEAAFIIRKENAANGLYDCLANGASVIHDDPQNIFGALEVHRRLRPKLVVDPPDSPLVVYYPVESEMLEGCDFNPERFVAQCASLRRAADFDLGDSFMLREGYLAGKSDLLLVTGCRIPRDAARLMLDFARQRGRVWVDAASRVATLEDDVELDVLARESECPVREGGRPGQNGLCRFREWPRFEPYASFGEGGAGGGRYVTVHRQCVSTYHAEEEDFEVRSRSAVPPKRR